MTESLVWFIIPLRAKATTSDWHRICRDLQGTLRSILNQRDGRFRVIVSCSEAPDLGDVVDSRIEIIAHEYVIPRDFEGYAKDKQAKKRRAAVRVRDAGGGYIMLVDADDFVSRDLVAYTLSNDNNAGFYADDGYVLYSSTRHLKRTREIYKVCGTCYVSYFSVSDLPQSPDDATSAFDEYKNHRLVLETADKQGKLLEAFPFPAVIYQLETGENLSEEHPNMQKRGHHWARRNAKRLLRGVLGRQAIPPEVSQAFGL